MIKFSVTIPAYKANYLKDCIDSVLAQTYSNFEIIIVDDHSPNNLQEIVDQYDDERISFYRNEVGFGGYNVVGNWDKCLEYATGDYMICMGDDDMLRPNTLQDYVTLIEKYPTLDVFHSRTEIVNEHGQTIDMQEPRPEYESVYSMIWNLWKGRDQFIGDFLFRTNRLREIGGFYNLPYAWSSDKITAYIMAGDKGIANTYEPGFQYRRNENNITSGGDTLRDRYKALLGERDWYREFLKTASEPSTNLDKIYCQLIEKSVDKYMAGRLDNMIEWDLGVNPGHIKYWWGRRKEYDISGARMRHYAVSALRAALFKLRK